MKAVFPLAAIFSTRLLGLFMVLPVLMLYINKMPGATPLLLGLALGIYGLSQALMQLPLGMLSDKFGRKPILLIGLGVFILGSVVAALANSVEMIIVGRVLQGMGAIGSTILAMVADVTHDKQRTIAMAIIGMSIGFAFFLAMLLGPVVNAFFALSGIFWLTAGLGVVAVLLVLFVVPDQDDHQNLQVPPSDSNSANDENRFKR